MSLFFQVQLSDFHRRPHGKITNKLTFGILCTPLEEFRGDVSTKSLFALQFPPMDHGPATLHEFSAFTFWREPIAVLQDTVIEVEPMESKSEAGNAQ